MAEQATEPNQLQEREDNKNAARRTELVGRKVKTLDQVTSGIRRRHRDALDNLQRMRRELEEKRKNVEFIQQARDALAAKIEADKLKASSLRTNVRRCEKAFGGLMTDMKEGA